MNHQCLLVSKQGTLVFHAAMHKPQATQLRECYLSYHWGWSNHTGDCRKKERYPCQAYVQVASKEKIGIDASYGPRVPPSCRRRP